MSDEWLFRLLRRFARPEILSSGTADLRTIDERLGVVEREQREIEARLRLLERQSDPRGIRGMDGG